jgi:hypothetical protein
MSAGVGHRLQFSGEIVLLPPDFSRFLQNVKSSIVESSIGPKNFPFWREKRRILHGLEWLAETDVY